MFIRKAAFEYLLKRSESQQEQIDKLSEMVGVLVKSVGQQYELDFGKDWHIQATSADHVDDGPQSGWSF
jgi:hypothetical protein